MKNVENWKEVIEKGLDPKSYTYAPDKVPVGDIEAVLDFKVWVKQAMGIGCYFTQTETGLRFVLTVFRGNQDGDYKVQNCPVDFAECSVEETYLLKVAMNRKGNPFIQEARIKEVSSI